MTLAVTKFEALCAFVAPPSSPRTSRASPNFAPSSAPRQTRSSSLLAAADVPARLRAVFTAPATADADTVGTQVDALAARLAAAASDALLPVDRLAARLTRSSRDVGVLCAYVLNYVVLEPGQCIFPAGNEPHAYLSGECVEHGDVG